MDALGLEDASPALCGRLHFSSWGSEVVAGGVVLRRAVAVTDRALFRVVPQQGGAGRTNRLPIQYIKKVELMPGEQKTVRLDVTSVESECILTFSDHQTALSFCRAIHQALDNIPPPPPPDDSTTSSSPPPAAPPPPRIIARVPPLNFRSPPRVGRRADAVVK
eukprot:Hpha_TRINITY_DN20542_c0_g1::TRINITY_DN20542_c0_g1_i1::g.30706::m.30706